MTEAPAMAPPLWARRWPTALTGEILLMTARATETVGLIWAPDTGRKIVLRVIIASPDVSPQYTWTPQTSHISHLTAPGYHLNMEMIQRSWFTLLWCARRWRRFCGARYQQYVEKWRDALSGQSPPERECPEIKKSEVWSNRCHVTRWRERIDLNVRSEIYWKWYLFANKDLLCRRPFWHNWFRLNPAGFIEILIMKEKKGRILISLLSPDYVYNL